MTEPGFLCGAAIPEGGQCTRKECQAAWAAYDARPDEDRPHADRRSK